MIQKGEKKGQVRIGDLAVADGRQTGPLTEMETGMKKPKGRESDNLTRP